MVSLGITSSSASMVSLFLWLLLYTNVGAETVSDEMEALTSFQDAIEFAGERSGLMRKGNFTFEPRGYGCTRFSSWRKTDKSPCDWVGIYCTADGSIQSIDLSGWGLTKLSSWKGLVRLQNLEQLILSRNFFEVPIPDHEGLGSLTTLRRLDLSDSRFNGELPPTLNQLWNLRSLHLDGNGFTGGIPRLDNLTRLQVLSLSGNQFDGPIPSHLNSLTELVSLNLSNNKFSDSIPLLTELVNLHALDLHSNRLTGFTDLRFPGPKNLEHLDTSRNQLGGELPVGLTVMENLKVLDMSFNVFAGDIPEGLARHINSYWLDLSHNHLRGKLPQDLFLSMGWQQSMFLNLSNNRLTGNIPGRNRSGSSNFAALDLSHNQLTGPLPRSVFGSKSAGLYGSRIRVMRLEDNQLEGDIIDILRAPGFYVAEEIRLARNRFTGDLTSFAEDTGQLSKSLGYELKILDLSNNMLTLNRTGKYPDPMRMLWNSLVNLTGLREFRIAGNRMEGISLPTTALYEGSPFLQVIDVSSNHLVGAILEEVFDPSASPFKSIKVLNFSDNNLTGPVPFNITRLPQLITLDVSNNNLSGELPKIPERSTLWNAKLFEGNPELCGGPLRACPSPQPPPIIIYVSKDGLSKGRLSAIILASVLVPMMASCLIIDWRWRVYRKLHEQDADLIATLMAQRESTALMPLRELKRATDNFAQSAQIGVGGFGTVYTGQLQDGTAVAIKRSKREGTEADKQRFLNEVRILSQVNHRHLVKLLGCCMENKVALLVLEFVPNGTLQEHLQGKKGSTLSWKQRLQIAVQTADALNYLHSSANHPIIHRDVKSANILLTEKFNVKVADFGISKLAPVEATHVSTVAVQGTMGYIDPEYYASYQLTAKSDVYSFGVVLLELISAQSVIDFKRPAGNASLITFAASSIQKEEFESLIDPALADSCNWQTRESIMDVVALAFNCLHTTSKDRPDMKEVWKELQILWLTLESSCDFFEGNQISSVRHSRKLETAEDAHLSLS